MRMMASAVNSWKGSDTALGEMPRDSMPSSFMVKTRGGGAETRCLLASKGSAGAEGGEEEEGKVVLAVLPVPVPVPPICPVGADMNIWVVSAAAAMDGTETGRTAAAAIVCVCVFTTGKEPKEYVQAVVWGGLGSLGILVI
jgi:hypothetical protein